MRSWVPIWASRELLLRNTWLRTSSPPSIISILLPLARSKLRELHLSTDTSPVPWQSTSTEHDISCTYPKYYIALFLLFMRRLQLTASMLHPALSEQEILRQ